MRLRSLHVIVLYDSGRQANRRSVHGAVQIYPPITCIPCAVCQPAQHHRAKERDGWCGASGIYNSFTLSPLERTTTPFLPNISIYMHILHFKYYE